MKKLNARGFTLVEVMVATVVMSIILIAISDFLLNNTVASVQASDRANILAQTEQSLDQLTTSIRLSANAADVNQWPDANGPSGNQYGWTSNSTTLILETAAVDTNGNIIFSDPETYVTTKNDEIFFLQNGTLYERILAAPVSGNSATTTCPSSDSSSTCPSDYALLSNIGSFSFNYYDGENQVVAPTDARAVQLNVTVTKNSYGTPITVKYSTWMVFRND